jgi:hypothetical protein
LNGNIFRALTKLEHCKIAGTLIWSRIRSKQLGLNFQNPEVTIRVWQEDEEEDDWLAAAAKQVEHNQARLEAKQELTRLARKEERLARIRARRAQFRIQEVQNNRNEDVLRKSIYLEINNLIFPTTFSTIFFLKYF